MFTLPIMVFDIETRPDVKLGRLQHGLDLPDDADVELALANLRKQDNGRDFPRLYMHDIVCISILWANQTDIKLHTLSAEQLTEKEMLMRFIKGIEAYFPVLVSWNGSRFDLPLVQLKAMKYHLTAKNLLDQGELDRNRKYDNYQGRFGFRHTDLMDILSAYNGNLSQRLDDVSLLLGLPGKQGDSGHGVSDMVREQRWQDLTRYCESDVLNTWLIYLRWQLLRGHIEVQEHAEWEQRTRALLQTKPQHASFLEAWQPFAEHT